LKNETSCHLTKDEENPFTGDNTNKT